MRGEEQALLRPEHERHIVPPPARGFGARPLQDFDRGGGLDGIAGGNPSLAGEEVPQRREEVAAAWSQARGEGRDRARMARRQRQLQPDPFLAHPVRRFARRHGNDPDRSGHGGSLFDSSFARPELEADFLATYSVVIPGEREQSEREGRGPRLSCSTVASSPGSPSLTLRAMRTTLAGNDICG